MRWLLASATGLWIRLPIPAFGSTPSLSVAGEDGEVLDLGVTNEEGTGGKAFLHSLVARDLAGDGRGNPQR